MPLLPLPHSAGCLVCSRENPHGLHLDLFANTDATPEAIQTTFMPDAHHIGFVGVVHGGVLATIADEVLVWSAIWSSRRACLAGELSIRFRRKLTVGEKVKVIATVTRARPRLIESECTLATTDGQLIAIASGKYVPLSVDDTNDFLLTLDRLPASVAAHQQLRSLP